MLPTRGFAKPETVAAASSSSSGAISSPPASAQGGARKPRGDGIYADLERSTTRAQKAATAWDDYCLKNNGVEFEVNKENETGMTPTYLTQRK